MNQVVLAKSKDKSAWQQHPWVFSGAIKMKTGDIVNGDIVSVVNIDGAFVAYGVYHNTSRVAVRLLEWDEAITIDESWWRTKLRNAISSRYHLLRNDNDTVRLVFAEADFLPGLIIDKYADYLSIQVHSAAVEKVKDVIVHELTQLLDIKGIYERSDLQSRAHEGLPNTNGLLWGQMPPEFVKIQENGIYYDVNIIDGQKSGFYCDQRDNRAITARYAKDMRVLDCFCYSGGFTLNALKSGASSVVSVDSSALAIETLERNILLNGFDKAKHKGIKSDVNQYLRDAKERGEEYDVIVLDPPKYAPTRSSLDKAARAYKDLNRRGMMLLRPGGLLATFSCSGAMDISTFKQVIAWAALDAGRQVQFIYQYTQPEDHPVRASFPEGEYLKGLLVRVL